MAAKTFKVCCCDDMPGIHLYGGECGDLTEFKPTPEELEYQKKCDHRDVFDGVCNACGKVVDEIQAHRGAK